jgi:hypothetical protein
MKNHFHFGGNVGRAFSITRKNAGELINRPNSCRILRGAGLWDGL